MAQKRVLFRHTRSNANTFFAMLQFNFSRISHVFRITYSARGYKCIYNLLKNSAFRPVGGLVLLANNNKLLKERERECEESHVSGTTLSQLICQNLRCPSSEDVARTPPSGEMDMSHTGWREVCT